MTAVRKKDRFCTEMHFKQIDNLVKQQTTVNATGDCKGQEPSWREGRRVIVLGTLADEMFCKGCSQPIHLMDISSEKRFGLASVFEVKCRTCGLSTSVASGKRHSKCGNDCRCFTVNTKLAAGRYSDVLLLY